MQNLLIINPLCGLCNYLRVIFYYLEIAKKQNKKLYVIWRITNECNGFFLDYFEPVDNIIFEKIDNIKFPNKKSLYHNKVNFTTWGSDDWVLNYSNLKLLTKYNLKIYSKLKQLECNYSSIHVRRVESLDYELAKNLWKSRTSDEIFINFINNQNTKYLYIATDNRDTQEYYYNKFKNKIKLIKFIESNNNLRQTNMEDCIIDLYMCVYSKNFRGTDKSSYTKLIHDLRKIHK